MFAAWLLAAIGFHALARFPTEAPLLLSVLTRFWQLPLLLAWFLAGVGLSVVTDRARSPRAWPGAAAVLCVLQLGLSLSDPGIRAQPNDGLVDQYGRELVASLPLNTVLISRGDLRTNCARYAALSRPDIAVLDSV